MGNNSKARMIVARYSRNRPLMFPQPRFNLYCSFKSVAGGQNRAKMVMACGHVTKAISYN
ncbi:MAG: hypothetical protein A2283_11215 [Lentisphaerae bacterium RIFOXYA12_FULL_48_11]|nr:MAG: hypothetical protein A2283_11215 [Lentisphaerae bacterium RIFOXYA12_FULL_48_11]